MGVKPVGYLRSSCPTVSRRRLNLPAHPPMGLYFSIPVCYKGNNFTASGDALWRKEGSWLDSCRPVSQGPVPRTPQTHER